MIITTTVIIIIIIIIINNVFTALFPLVCMQASGEHALGNEYVTRALFVAGIFSFFMTEFHGVKCPDHTGRFAGNG